MWEHKVLFLFDSELQETLDEEGDRGWELVSVAVKGTYQCFFKRKKATPITPYTSEEIKAEMLRAAKEYPFVTKESGDYPK